MIIVQLFELTKPENDIAQYIVIPTAALKSMSVGGVLRIYHYRNWIQNGKYTNKIYIFEKASKNSMCTLSLSLLIDSKIDTNIL